MALGKVELHVAETDDEDPDSVDDDVVGVRFSASPPGRGAGIGTLKKQRRRNFGSNGRSSTGSRMRSAMRGKGRSREAS